VPAVTGRGLLAGGGPGLAAATAGALRLPLASGETNLQLTQGLLWVMIGISVAATIITFAFLVYAVWKFRDRGMRGRRYG
jgi:heme/copper-type cytochrome/quinol oxidase subunit 2